MPKETELIKEKLDLVEFLRGYLTLTPAGKNFKALCPFHQEKTPSFIVSPERQMWHCFGCGEGGDIFKFLMRYENLEFPEALRFLAEKAGVALRSVSPREQREFGVLFDLHEAARQFYEARLEKQVEAQSYLMRRGLRPETIQEFRLGFAPGGETLTLHLIEKGYDVGDIARAGLAHKNVRGLYRDRFQDRIIFPITNAVGKVVAFTGRLLPREGAAAPSREGELPKYLNSPETPIFVKSRILFGFDKAKSDIARSRAVIIVEGQMDMLMAWQAGARNTVAVSGTGLSNYHLERLRRMADVVYVSFDNDEAGMRALDRSIDLFNQFDFHLKAINLGSFKDPADAVLENPQIFTNAVASAKPAYEYLLLHLFRGGSGEEVASRKRAVKSFLEKARNIKSAAEQDVWIRALSRSSGISEVALLLELSELPEPRSGAGVAPNEDSSVPANAREEHDRALMIGERLLAIAFTKEVFWDTIKNHKDWFPEALQRIIDNPHVEEGALVALRSGMIAADDEADLARETDDLLKQLHIEMLRREQEKLRREMRAAEQRNDEKQTLALMSEIGALARKIDELRLS